MFENLHGRLQGVFKKLKGHGKLNEKNISDAMREVKRALLEADVNFKVVKNFIERVKSRAVGAEVAKSLTPGQQVIKIVNEELSKLMGTAARSPEIDGPSPQVIMVVGLQGAGKTTMCGKLANYYRAEHNKNPLLVAADIYRPAAIDQLKKTGASLNIPVFSLDKAKPEKICRKGVDFASKNGNNLVILDTAGRLHIDKEMMKELQNIRKKTKPARIFFTADAMTGQDAVNSSREFNEALDYDGILLTKMDGDARGGAALSMLAVTGKHIYFTGTGEKPSDIEVFHPDRMASRILGMGDVLTLIEKAEKDFDEKEAKKLEKKLKNASFNFEDFRNQLQQIKKLGPLSQIMSMIPGMGGKIPEGEIDDNSLVKVEAIINSMTKQERNKPGIINGSRRKRIANGSGTQVQDVNKLLKQFDSMKKMMKKFSKMSGRGRIPAGNFPGGMPF
ncbi:MAG: signal recognition particle protein [Fibrobacterota bacterium]